MLLCVNGEGQGCCDLCKIIRGWHREWSSMLFYVVNSKGKKLCFNRKFDEYCFSDSSNNEIIRHAVFCRKHALLVDSSRSQYTDY